MLQRSSISTTPKIAILPYALSIFPFLCVSELHGALSSHIFEETAERSLVFKSVSYTHLTLPTIREVLLWGVGGWF